MREDIKKVVENYRKKQNALKKEKEMKQLTDYLHAIGYHANIFKGVGPSRHFKTAKYCYEIDGLFYASIEYSLNLNNEELKELYAAIPPEEVLKAQEKHRKETIGRGLRIWSKILMVLSVLSGIGFVLYGLSDDEGVWFYSGIGILLTLLPLCCFYRTVADIADSLNA